MALVKCPECGTEVSEKAAACVKCGHPIASPTASGPEPSQTELTTASVKDSGAEGPSSDQESVQEITLITPCARCRKRAVVEIVGRGRDYPKLFWAAAGFVGFLLFGGWHIDTIDSPDTPPFWIIGVLLGLMAWTAYSTWFGLKTQDIFRCTNCGKCIYGGGFIGW